MRWEFPFSPRDLFYFIAYFMAKRNVYFSLIFFTSVHYFSKLSLRLTIPDLQDTPVHKIMDPVTARLMKMFFCCSVLSQKPERWETNFYAQLLYPKYVRQLLPNPTPVSPEGKNCAHFHLWSGLGPEPRGVYLKSHFTVPLSTLTLSTTFHFKLATQRHDTFLLLSPQGWEIRTFSQIFAAFTVYLARGMESSV